MKRIILFCFLYTITTLACAQTCPSAKDILVEQGGNYYVVAPSGWRIVSNDKELREKNLAFVVAAWGDHKHPSDRVRCHYYRDFTKDHVQLETEEFIDESRISSHPEWGYDDRYGLCVSRSDDVRACQFS